MAITIIDRTEQKYFVSEDNYQKLMTLLNGKLTKDIYFKERICNIYFDNDNYELISTSLDKPTYKEKVRLRSYNKPKENTTVFLEIKKKYKGKGNKRRIELNYSEALNYIEKGIMPNNINKQIMNEIDYIFKIYNLKPKISLTYDRYSYYLNEDNSFRITFDYNIKYDNKELYLSNLENSNTLLKEGYIMELKLQNGIPLWFSKILNELKIYPTSFSKVGKAYTKLREDDLNV